MHKKTIKRLWALPLAVMMLLFCSTGTTVFATDIKGYNANDLDIINGIILNDSNLSLEYTVNDPDSWPSGLIEWTESVTDKRVYFLNLSIADSIGKLDVSGLASLNTLYCYNSQLTDLGTLPDSLTVLHCPGNQLTNLGTLPDSLIELDCSNNQLTDLRALPNSLTSLVCSDNQLTNLGTLPNSLTMLICFNNQLTDLGTLPNSLTQLYCDGNQLTNLGTLPNSLTQLWCKNNQLTDLDISKLNKLTYLWCSDNQLTDLGTLPNSLTDLNCDSNQLKNLGTLPNSLRNLSCGDNQLINFETLPNSLVYLACSNNRLTDLGTLPNSLRSLVCLNNQLTDLGMLPNLTQLYCDGNQLTDLGALPNSLTTLYCYNNQLTNLDLSGLAALKRLLCDNNPLASFTDSNGNTLTIQSNGGGNVLFGTIDPGIFDDNSYNFSTREVTLTAVPDSGKVLNNWTDGISNSGTPDNPLVFNLSASGTVTANFTTPTNAVTVTLPGDTGAYPDIPKTGDDGNPLLWLWFLIPSLLVTGIAAWQVIRRCKAAVEH